MKVPKNDLVIPRAAGDENDKQSKPFKAKMAQVADDGILWTGKGKRHFDNRIGRHLPVVLFVVCCLRVGDGQD